MQRIGNWIKTYSGINFYPLDPKPEEISLIDIGHALSNICRFTGHTNKFYSVAQHSVYVSVYASPENALWGLMHDASEAYLCDLASPIKQAIPKYQEYEKNIMKAVAEKFNLSWPIPEEINIIDRKMLFTEARDLGIKTDDWRRKENPLPSPTKIYPQMPENAERSFYDWYEVLCNRFSDVMVGVKGII